MANIIKKLTNQLSKVTTEESSRIETVAKHIPNYKCPWHTKKELF